MPETAAQAKDVTIRRQAQEIACLSANIARRDELTQADFRQRSADLYKEYDAVLEENRQRRDIIHNTLKALRILSRDENERIKFLIAMEVVDEDWYNSTYPDVATGYVKGALHHYCKFGIGEGRFPNKLMHK